ncbi:MAG: response regulator, partial [Nitrospirota bacterium]
MREKILIVADELDMGRLLSRVVSGAGIYSVISAPSSEVAFEMIRSDGVDLVLMDIKSPEKDRVGLLERLRQIDDMVQVILLTSIDTIEWAKTAIEREATSYITKPFNNDELVLQINRVLERQRLSRRDQNPKREYRYGNIIGNSREMQKVYNLI